MFRSISIPPSFSLIKKKKTLLILKDVYKDFLIQQGIEDLEIFLKRQAQTARYLAGRSLHPSILIKDGEWMIVRRYSHGGLFGLITRDLYLFGSRSIRELVLTEKIRSSGIPTVETIGAIHRSTRFPFYQSYILSLEVPHALNLIQYIEEIGPYPSLKNLSQKRKVIRSAGILLRQFHDMGFYHGDLQLKNILIAREQPLLIDFDRSYRKPFLSLRKRMKNLLRLNRSIEKWKRFGLPISRTDRWRFFLSYAKDDVKMRKAMQKVVRTYSIRHLFYRMGWTIEKIVRS
jgi:tRNA A-37 threonylcarbamoyl transferase component Bud32